MSDKDSVSSQDIPAVLRALGTLALAAATVVAIKWIISRDNVEKEEDKDTKLLCTQDPIEERQCLRDEPILEKEILGNDKKEPEVSDVQRMTILAFDGFLHGPVKSSIDTSCPNITHDAEDGECLTDHQRLDLTPVFCNPNNVTAPQNTLNNSDGVNDSISGLAAVFVDDETNYTQNEEFSSCLIQTYDNGLCEMLQEQQLDTGASNGECTDVESEKYQPIGDSNIVTEICAKQRTVNVDLDKDVSDMDIYGMNGNYHCDCDMSLVSHTEPYDKANDETSDSISVNNTVDNTKVNVSKGENLLNTCLPDFSESQDDVSMFMKVYDPPSHEVPTRCYNTEPQTIYTTYNKHDVLQTVNVIQQMNQTTTSTSDKDTVLTNIMGGGHFQDEKLNITHNNHITCKHQTSVEHDIYVTPENILEETNKNLKLSRMSFTTGSLDISEDHMSADSNIPHNEKHSKQASTDVQLSGGSQNHMGLLGLPAAGAIDEWRSKNTISLHTNHVVQWNTTTVYNSTDYIDLMSPRDLHAPECSITPCIEKDEGQTNTDDTDSLLSENVISVCTERENNNLNADMKYPFKSYTSDSIIQDEPVPNIMTKDTLHDPTSLNTFKSTMIDQAESQNIKSTSSRQDNEVTQNWHKHTANFLMVDKEEFCSVITNGYFSRYQKQIDINNSSCSSEKYKLQGCYGTNQQSAISNPLSNILQSSQMPMDEALCCIPFSSNDNHTLSVTVDISKGQPNYQQIMQSTKKGPNLSIENKGVGKNELTSDPLWPSSVILGHDNLVGTTEQTSDQLWSSPVIYGQDDLVGRLEETSDPIFSPVLLGQDDFVGRMEETSEPLSTPVILGHDGLEGRIEETSEPLSTPVSLGHDDLVGRMEETSEPLSTPVILGHDDLVGRMEETSEPLSTPVLLGQYDFVGRMEETSEPFSTPVILGPDDLVGRVKETSDSSCSPVILGHSDLVDRMEETSDSLCSPVILGHDDLVGRMEETPEPLSTPVILGHDDLVGRVKETSDSLCSSVILGHGNLVGRIEQTFDPFSAPASIGHDDLKNINLSFSDACPEQDFHPSCTSTPSNDEEYEKSLQSEDLGTQETVESDAQPFSRKKIMSTIADTPEYQSVLTSEREIPLVTKSCDNIYFGPSSHQLNYQPFTQSTTKYPNLSIENMTEEKMAQTSDPLWSSPLILGHDNLENIDLSFSDACSEEEILTSHTSSPFHDEEYEKSLQSEDLGKQETVESDAQSFSREKIMSKIAENPEYQSVFTSERKMPLVTKSCDNIYSGPSSHQLNNQPFMQSTKKDPNLSIENMTEGKMAQTSDPLWSSPLILGHDNLENIDLSFSDACSEEEFLTSRTSSPFHDEEYEKSLKGKDYGTQETVESDAQSFSREKIMSKIAETPEYQSVFTSERKMPLVTKSCDNIFSGPSCHGSSLKNKAQSMLCILTEYYTTKLHSLENGPLEEVARGCFIRIPKGFQNIREGVRFQLTLGNCLEFLKLARKNSVPELLKAVYTLISDNYLNVLKNSAIYGQLTGLEREKILQLRMRGKLSLCIIETESIFGLNKNISRSEDTISDEPKDQLYSLDMESNQWKRVTNIPEEACLKGCSICSMHNYLFIAGGVQKSKNGLLCSNKLFCYNPLTDIWTQLSPMNQARSQLKLVPLDGYLYAIGGECLHTMERYDPRSNKWTFVASLPKGSFAVAHEAAACGGEIYISGGHLFYRLLKYNPVRDEWVECPFNASKERSCDMVAVGHILYRFDMHKDSTVHIFKYNTTAKVWSEYTSTFPNSKVPFRCVVLDGTIYCLNRETCACFSLDEEKAMFESTMFSRVPTKGVGYPCPVVLCLRGSLSQTSV